MLKLVNLKRKVWHVHFLTGLQEIRVKLGFLSTVHLFWPSIQIVNILDKHRFKAIEFEREFYINKKTAIKLQRILKNTFTSQPVVLHKDKMSPIATCSEDCVHVPQILKPSAPQGEQVKNSTLHRLTG